MAQIDIILSRLANVKKQPGEKYRASCPCPHHKKSNNDHLMVSERDDGSVGISCFAHCTTTEVLYEIELKLNDLYPPRSEEDQQNYRNQEAARRAMKHEYDEAHKFWLSLVILEQTMRSRLFDGQKHPTCKNDLWPKEKEAVRMLGNQFREYYKF